VNELATIEHKLSRALGLRARPAAACGLARELESLRVEHGISASEVVARMDRERWLIGRLAGAITVEESFFLRHPEQFELLVEHLRPMLVAGTRPVRIWSAGCASGEEPYSIAIAIHRSLGAEALGRVSITANDASSSAIQRARAGTYGEWSFRGVPAQVRSRYFEANGASELCVVPAIRAAVQFEHATFEEQLERIEPASLDVIFFRNVAIHMTPESLSGLYAAFARALRRSGLLVLGLADSAPARAELEHVRVIGGYTLSGASPLAPAAPVSVPGTCIAASTSARTRAAARLISARPAECSKLPAALDLANAGRATQALALVEDALAQRGPSAELLGLSACIHLAEGRVQKGVELLRAALFLSPGELLLRFHYALGLAELGRQRAARAQLLDILEAVAAMSNDRVLGDGQTTAHALERAARERLRELE
jgi:chemotaxis protein methyltransferase CheR